MLLFFVTLFTDISNRVLMLLGNDRYSHVNQSASKKETNAWFLYDWANGAYFYSALNFLPLIITTQAKIMARAHFCGECLLNEWAKDFENIGKCEDSQYKTFTTCNDAGSEWEADFIPDARFINVAGLSIGYASFPQYCTTLSVLFQLVLYIGLGSFADYGSNRKRMFIITNTIGILACFAVFFTIGNDLYWLMGLWYILSSAAFSFAVVFYNAYLPLLASAQRLIVDARRNQVTTQELVALEKEMNHDLSIKGLAIGFAGQLVFLLCSLGILFGVEDGDHQLTLRAAVAAAGVWVLFFSTISFYYLKTRPGPDLPGEISYVRHSIDTAKKTWSSFKKLRELRKFLIAYFIFSDGSSTLAAAALIFGQEELNVSTSSLGLILIEVSVLGILGCRFYIWLHKHHAVTSKTILILTLVQMGCLPLYAIFAMTTQVEFFIAGGLFGFNTGAQQAFTRSIYSQFIPSGREAEYFSFYEISDKGTAWLGPLVLGLVFQATGSYRHAFSTLVVFFVIGTLCLLPFNAQRATTERMQFEHDDKEDVHVLREEALSIPNLQPL